MQKEDLIKAIRKLKIWQKGDQRAPHKPLLILYALGRLSRDEPQIMAYSDVWQDLKNLLIEFGPYRQNYSPGYPFVRLTNDGIWDIGGLDALNPKKNWSDRELIENQTIGGFTSEVFNLLKTDGQLVRDVAEEILNRNFPNTLHQDILDQVGLNLELTETSMETKKKLSRSPDFRNRVLQAYEYRCAVCDFNVRLGYTLVAVEAAHIKWHQAGGPDLEQNGIAFCSLHHKLFDRGVFTLSGNMVFQVAENAHGTHGMDEWLMRYHGQKIRKPLRPDYLPEEGFVNWHVREVFRGPARRVY